MELSKLSISLIILHVNPDSVPGQVLELLCVATESCVCKAVCFKLLCSLFIAQHWEETLMFTFNML